MKNFAPKLFKAASNAEVLPVSKERSDEPFESPVFEDYLAKNDIAGYMTALWKGVAARDAESMRVLFYLSIRDEELDNALDLLDMLLEMDDEYALAFWYYCDPLYKEMEEAGSKDLHELQLAFESSLAQGDIKYRELYPDYQSLYDRFGDQEIPMLRAYINNVGRQPESSSETVKAFKDCAPQDKKDYWRSLYRRSDCSSNQIGIYHDAMSYADKGDPYAMYIVGYLLSHGIETKYDNPHIVLLPLDKDKALPWLINATKAGVRQAFWEVGSIYLDRSHRDDEHKAELKEQAMRYIRQGAELGDYHCLDYMVRYIDDDAAKVAHLERIVEEHGDNKARLQLADHYENGLGCEVNPKRAFELVEYVYKHSSVSPYDSSQEDSAHKLAGYLRSGFGCEKDPEYAGKIISWLDDENDRMWELLTK